MSSKVKTVHDYLIELDRSRENKPAQIKEALDIFIDLWRKVIEKGIIKETDEIPAAISKIDQQGGLYQAAED